MAERRITRRTARAIIGHKGYVLAMGAHGERFLHLPGGGIEPVESAKEALYRELDEELGIEPITARLLATVENDWQTQPIHEVLSLYAVTLAAQFNDLRSREISSTLHMIPWAQAGAANIQPKEILPWVATVAGKS